MTLTKTVLNSFLDVLHTFASAEIIFTKAPGEHYLVDRSHLPVFNGSMNRLTLSEVKKDSRMYEIIKALDSAGIWPAFPNRTRKRKRVDYRERS